MAVFQQRRAPWIDINLPTSAIADSGPRGGSFCFEIRALLQVSVSPWVAASPFVIRMM